MKIRIPDKLRPLGIYIAGNPGNGKSSLIQRAALFDIRAGRGVCIIDPTGDLFKNLIHHIPEARKDDTILFTTSGPNPIPIDFFSYRDPDERQVLTDDTTSIFNLDAAPRARPLLRKILGTLFDANENGAAFSFFDIRTFCTNPRKVLDRCPPDRKELWKNDLPQPKEYEPILDRLSYYEEAPILKKVLAGPKAPLNIARVIEQGQVLLIDLKDTETDLFLGSLIAAKIRQAIWRRRPLDESVRTPYAVYIDEAHTILKFAASDFETILTRARKYNLWLTLANQLPSDLPEPIRRKLGTIGTVVLFNLDFPEALPFKHRIDPFVPEDLVALPKFTAIAVSNRRAHRIRTPRFLGPSDASFAEYIRKRMKDLPTFTAAPKDAKDASVKDDGDESGEDDPTVLPDDPETRGTRTRRPPRSSHDQ